MRSGPHQKSPITSPRNHSLACMQTYLLNPFPSLKSSFTHSQSDCTTATSMIRLPIPRFTRIQRLTPILTQHYSSSHSPSSTPDNTFIKTGKRPPSDPTAITQRSYEYSQSGGDDMVAEQEVASFNKDPDSDSSKMTAGKGNVVNPLELSPATPELSVGVSEAVS